MLSLERQRAIFEEVQAEFGITRPTHADIERWARSGALEAALDYRPTPEDDALNARMMDRFLARLAAAAAHAAGEEHDDYGTIPPTRP